MGKRDEDWILKKHKAFLELAWKTYKKERFIDPTITRKEICKLFNTPARASRKGLKIGDAEFPNWLMNDPKYRVERGVYKLPKPPKVTTRHLSPSSKKTVYKPPPKKKKFSGLVTYKPPKKSGTFRSPSGAQMSDSKMKTFLGYETRWKGSRYAKLPKTQKRITRKNSVMNWQKKIDACHRDTDLMLLVNDIATYGRWLEKSELCLVWNRKFGVTMGIEHDQHQQVKDMVKKYGGEQIFGWYLTSSYSDPESGYPPGLYSLRFHSVWRNPWDGELVNLTPHPQPWLIFLPDPTRWFDFDRKMSYNTRVLFGQKYPLSWDDPKRSVQIVDPNLGSKASAFFTSTKRYSSHKAVFYTGGKSKHPKTSSPIKRKVYFKGAENYYSPYPFHERCLTERNLLKYLTDEKFHRSRKGGFIPVQVFANPHTSSSRAWLAMHLGEVPVR